MSTEKDRTGSFKRYLYRTSATVDNLHKQLIEKSKFAVALQWFQAHLLDVDKPYI